MTSYLFYITSCPGDVISFQVQHTEAAFIQHLNDKTVAFNNQVITCLLVLTTHGCKHCQTHGFTVQQNQQTNLFLISNCKHL